ncbi:MAG: TIGR03560 family F420-dependent LLM class oxidoreductase [Pseudomonadales bacterium]
MKFSFWPKPTHTFDETQYLAQKIEHTGWDGLWLADHFMPNAEDTSAPWPEALTTLSALAAVIPRIRLGTLVVGNTYRHPAVLAKMAATIDHISGGRMVLGLGAGWQENEHAKYGIEFFNVPGRLARLEEACQVIKCLFQNESSHFEGDFYRLAGAPLEPKPVQNTLPLLIGGGGEKVTLRITAQYADEWNVWGTVNTLEHKMRVLDEHCERLGRDPRTLKRTAVALVYLTNDTAFAEKMRNNAQATIAGSVSVLQDTVAAYEALGVDELIVPNFNFREEAEDVMDQLISEVFAPFKT